MMRDSGVAAWSPANRRAVSKMRASRRLAMGKYEASNSAKSDVSRRRVNSCARAMAPSSPQDRSDQRTILLSGKDASRPMLWAE